jgi:serine protease Do
MALDIIEQAEKPTAVALPSISDAIVEMLAKARKGVVEVRGRGRGAGAGIIWGGDGKIMTNYHVVAGTGGRPQIHLNDGRRFGTRLVAENPALDLAMLEVEGKDLPALPIGDSSRLRVGELVFAVGHPWGHKDVVTAGIVSGLGRVTGVQSGRSADYIRSDVRLAPGNSGGPLLNASGEVIGVNSMIFGGDMSVAVPSHVALDWLARAGQRAYLGVGVRPMRINSRGEGGPDVTAGVIVVGLDPEGPASKAGVRLGDVLLAVADQPVTDTATLRRALSQGVSEGKTELAIIRGKVPLSLEVHLAEAA